MHLRSLCKARKLRTLINNPNPMGQKVPNPMILPFLPKKTHHLDPKK